ncbi:ribosome-associated translation inhibitor RaiA [Candidatus Dependentiae bacterium]|jgi:ribosomal subunit interface protein|nr:ribosome-associated translation inhibitor RaiA [Candidatus Dependentiae bacterium]
MNIKITFQNMPHSDSLEAHTNQKLEKIFEFLNTEQRPFNVEFWLKAHKVHPHHVAEMHLKTKNFDLMAHDEGADMYVAVDNTIDKMVKLIKKEKQKMNDRHHKVPTDKSNFNR